MSSIAGRAVRVHLRQLGSWGHVLIGHGVHIDDDELEAILETVRQSPPARGRTFGSDRARPAPFVTSIWLGGGQLAIGCDTENAGGAIDAVRLLRCLPALRKTFRWTRGFTAHHALELLTRQVQAIGMGNRSLDRSRQQLTSS